VSAVQERFPAKGKRTETRLTTGGNKEGLVATSKGKHARPGSSDVREGKGHSASAPRRGKDFPHVVGRKERGEYRQEPAPGRLVPPKPLRRTPREQWHFSLVVTWERGREEMREHGGSFRQEGVEEKAVPPSSLLEGR